MSTHTFPLDGPINLLVRIGHGSVTVETATDLTQAGVRLEGGKGSADDIAQFAVEMRGPTLQVIGPRQGGIFDLGVFAGRHKHKGVDVHVTVPVGTAVKISTFTAPIWIPGRVGGADLAVGTGEVGVREVDGDLRLRFGRGSVRAVKVSGSVQVRSGSGDAVFGEIGGDLHAGCGSGGLRARVVHGSVTSRCGSGAARLGAVHGDVDLASGSGGVEIGLPIGVSARLDVQTGSGRVRSDLPIEEQAEPANQAITIRARTGSGDVHLFRAA
jgi:hypothetical protein